jgi:hypothetical protein
MVETETSRGRLARAFGAAVLLIAAIAGIGAAGAQPTIEEHILSFASDVSVRRDASLEVVETIRLRAEGQQISHGIYREFPKASGFEVENVQRDGRPEPWRAEPADDGIRIWMGDPNTLLATGEHVYAIRYRTTNQLGAFPGYDELYWNVTGTGWAFAIDQAEIRVHVPSPVRFGNRAYYTGPAGSQGRDARVVEERPGEILLRTTRRLERGEGFTVGVAWPSGLVGRR